MPLAFEQQPGEGHRAFAAFTLYLSMGRERTLAKVAQQLKLNPQIPGRWSFRYGWSARVAAYNAHMATVEREAAEALARGKAAEWLTRQQALRETEWRMHEKCIAAAERGLKAYMEREKVYANLSDIARMLEIASKLGRMASGLVTDSVEHSGEVNVNFRAEVAAAVRKVYGEPVEVEVIADRKELPDAGS